MDAPQKKFDRKEPSAAKPQPNSEYLAQRGAKAAKEKHIVISTEGRNLSQIPRIRSG
jgi:hypothetical protein